MAAKKRKSSHGGRRRGSGRKPGGLPPELVELVPSIEAAIKSPIKLARYYTTVLGLLTHVRLCGGANAKSIDKLAKEIRANATAAGKVIPADIQFTASLLNKNADDEMKREKGPEQEKRDPAKAGALVRATEA